MYRRVDALCPLLMLVVAGFLECRSGCPEGGSSGAVKPAQAILWHYADCAVRKVITVAGHVPLEFDIIA